MAIQRGAGRSASSSTSIFERIEDAIAAERQVKGWRREKKEVLMRGEHVSLPLLARRYAKADLGKAQ